MFKMVNYRRIMEMRIFGRRQLNMVLAFMLVLVGGCSESESEFSRDLVKIENLDHGTREQLLSAVSNLVSRMSEDYPVSRRDAIFDALISRVVEIEFSPPGRNNTPDESMINYAEFLKGVAQILRNKIPPEKTLDMFLRGLKRFELEISHVDEWTHSCYPSPEDWGFPPETDEVLACLRSGDTNGVHASPRTRKILRGMSPDLRRRLPGIVMDVLNSKSGGSRASNFKTGIECRKVDLLKTIGSEFMYVWALELEPEAYEVLRSRFREETGCNLPANGDRISFRTNINCRVAK